MKLWLLRRPSGEVNYDEYDAKIVRASTAEQAKELADDSGDEYGNTFPTENVTVEEITVDGDPEVILGSFCAG